MEGKQKVQQFRIEIRKRALNQKLANLRASQISNQPNLSQIEQALPVIASLLQQGQPQAIAAQMSTIKRYSHSPQVIALLKSHLDLLFGILLSPQKWGGQDLFLETVSVLINYSSVESIQLSGEGACEISKLVNSLKISKRQMHVLWLLSNFLLRRNQLAACILQILIKQDLPTYLLQRFSAPFTSETDLTLFYYFTGAIAANLQYSPSFAQYRKLLQTLETIGASQQSGYWSILEGLSDHASTINKFDYLLLDSPLIKRCQFYCRNKKSRFITKYLDFFTNFLIGEDYLLATVPEEGKAKLLAQQYERIKSQGMLKNLEFCLQNRSQEVKRGLLKVAFQLVNAYHLQIHFISEYFYLTLADNFHQIETLEEKTVVFLLRYVSMILSVLLRKGTVLNINEYKEPLMTFIKDTDLFSKINSLLKQYQSNTELQSVSFDIIAYVIDYQLPELTEIIQKADLMSTLNVIPCVESISNKRDLLVSFFSVNNTAMEDI